METSERRSENTPGPMTERTAYENQMWDRKHTKHARTGNPRNLPNYAVEQPKERTQ